MQAFLDLLEASKSVEDAMQNILKELDTRFQASKQITAEVSDTGHQPLLLKPLHIFLKAYLQDLCNQQSTEWRKIDRTHHVSVALIHAYTCLFGRKYQLYSWQGHLAIRTFDFSTEIILVFCRKKLAQVPQAASLPWMQEI